MVLKVLMPLLVELRAFNRFAGGFVREDVLGKIGRIFTRQPDALLLFVVGKAVRCGRGKFQLSQLNLTIHHRCQIGTLGRPVGLH